MKQTCFYYFSLIFLITTCSIYAQSDAKTFYNEDFKWTIEIPEDFVNVDPVEWAKLEDRGAEAIEATFGEEIVDRAETIFVLKNGEFNYLESNYQPFDVEVDGDYLESFKIVNEILYETFKAQMPDAVLSASTSVEQVSGLDFQTYKMTIEYPNGMTLHSIMFSRLFDKKEFTVNILYIDEKQGEKMVNAWINSKFE